MPIFSPSQLEVFTSEVFRAAGTPEDIAQHLAKSLVVSNLMGHDSHGVLRIPSYLESIAAGSIVPSARPVVQKETASTALVDGKWAFGQITATVGAKLAIEKARTTQVAAACLVRCNHIGRLGEYTEMAAREGMVAIMMGGTYNEPAVTPYGGATRVMGTNPISFSVPTADDPVVADIATSVAAEGKLRVARAKKQPIPLGIILDKDGNPSTNADDYYAGGVLLPFGGHKGYVLSVVVDLLARHIGGGEAMVKEYTSFGNLLVVLNVEAFRPLTEYQSAVGERLQEIKRVKPAPGFDEVMLPGEVERRVRAKREREGIELPEDTVRALRGVAEERGVVMPLPLS